MPGKPYYEACHLVVDIETLGVKIPAPILSIGVAMLDCSNGIPATLSVRNIQVDPARCIGAPETASVLWWMNSKMDSARAAALEPESDDDPFAAFLKLIDDFKPDYFWGKSPDFDFGHLEAQLAHQGLPIPWKFWQLRDIRTIEGLGCPMTDDEIFTNPPAKWVNHDIVHTADYDAWVEARSLYAVVIHLSQSFRSGT